MDNINPYASPQAPSEVIPLPKSAYNAWRSGDVLVVAKGSKLPGLCVKCNQPADGHRKKMNLAWYPPVAYLGLLLGLLPLIIIIVLIQKKMSLDISVCPDHRRRRRNVILLAWFGSLAGIALIILATMSQGNTVGLLVLTGMTLLLASLIFAAFASRIIWPKRIDKQFAWINGAGPEFLIALPEFPD